MRKLLLPAALLAALVCAPIALAASSPTVVPGAATAIGQTSAKLHGTVNPNGLATTYQFEYGTTESLGSASPATAASAGSGTAAVSESTTISGLSPDTTYYYELVATNSSGSSSTALQTLKTTGNPAPTSTTDPATAVARYTATLEATINPDNQATTYYFQYGLTSSYGFQTAPAVIAAGTTPVNVSALLVGIAPGATFHYRVIATHGATSTTYGADAVFATLPWPRPHSTLSYSVTPRTDSKAPYEYTVRGHLVHAATIPAALACHGTVTIRYYDGTRELASRTATVVPTCTYSASVRIGRLPATAKRPLVLAKPVATHITIRQHYNGDTYQAPSTTLSSTVSAG